MKNEKILLSSPHMSEEGYEKKFVKDAFDTNWIAPLDGNVNRFKDMFSVRGKYYFSEINPRSGGGYPHPYECDFNFLEYLLSNLECVSNFNNHNNYKSNILMMKYSDLEILKERNKR